MYFRSMFQLWRNHVTDMYYTQFFYKLLGSGLSCQRCLHFQGFLDSKLLNGCLVTYVTYVREKYSNFQDSKSIYMISNFKIFPIMLLRGPNFCVQKFNSYFTFITKEKLFSSLICSFYCCLVKKG